MTNKEKLDLVKKKVYKTEIQYEFYMTHKKRKEKLINLEDLSEDLIKNLKDEKHYLSLILAKAREEEIPYQKRRLKYLDGAITENIEALFPFMNLVSDLECNFNRANMKLKLYLIDEMGNRRPPSVTEGDCLQELVSHTAVTAAMEILGMYILYIDEAFSMASEGIKQDLQKILFQCVSKGFQIIIVSQSPLLYRDLAHRRLKLQRKENKVVETEITDFEAQLEE